MKNVKNTLNNCVYGHDNAKKQVERVIGQWVNSCNGEQKGYVLGFEGNPGIGKTTLAKGLADCLKDEHGNSRPYFLLAVGGDSNSSTYVGHSYTFVGSIWGKIAQILMDGRIMNPVIVLDEIDKLSKTEHGREVIGILTHMLDSTQNSTFEDKYFSGIHLDLSKVLFILSYNDASSIDPILLDRVHRIKFDSLNVDDKIVIAKKHLLPEIYKNVGLEEMIEIKDETIKTIIEDYTMEPGVRKLKEKLFEIVGEINLNCLQKPEENIDFPITVTIDDIKQKYFKDKHEIQLHKVHTESKVGVINALWANEYSMGGVLPLQVSFIPSSQFLSLTLTGSLGDVMKESISVSLTNAWNLTTAKRQKELIKQYNNSSKHEVFGLHIHCPDISTSKDGPSATTAFTVLIYSLFNNRKIKNYFGITGETSFDYLLTEIGGLQHKIIHSIPMGIKEFIFPTENKKDFDKMMEKYKDKDVVKGIKFHCIQTIQEVFDLILEK
jgi:ATP-dependent Lon protease